MKKVLNRAGQSTLEYVIVLTAIVAAILYAAVTFVRPSVNKVYSDGSSAMNNSGSMLVNRVGGGINLGGTTGGGTTGGGTTGGLPI